MPHQRPPPGPGERTGWSGRLPSGHHRCRLDTAGVRTMAEDRRRIGFIGLGLMGQAFTRRLVACGHAVTGYDIVPDKVEAARGHGVEPARSAAEVVLASDQVHVCVMTGGDLEAAVFGPDGIAAGGGPGKVLVDHSTTEVETTRAFAAAAAHRDRHGLGRRPGLGRPARGGRRHARDHGRRQRGRPGPGPAGPGRPRPRAPTWGRSAPARSPRWSTRSWC